METGYDWVYIYDGTTVNAPLIGAYNSSSQPGTVYGTSASGALTLRMTHTRPPGSRLAGFYASLQTRVAPGAPWSRESATLLLGRRFDVGPEAIQEAAPPAAAAAKP